MYPAGEYVVATDRLHSVRDAVADVVRRHPNRCLPFFPFDPRRENALDELKLAIRHFGFIGIKLYTRQGWLLHDNERLTGSRETGTLLDTRVKEMLEWACSEQIPIVNHHSPGGWPPAECIAFPRGKDFGNYHHAARQIAERAIVAAVQANVLLPEPFDRHPIRYDTRHFDDRFALRKVAIAELTQNRQDVLPRLLVQDKQIETARRSYVEEFKTALHEYVKLTTEPQMWLNGVVPPTTRFCMAHCGTDVVLPQRMSNESRLYGTNGQGQPWLTLDIIKDVLTQRPNAFVDISYFSQEPCDAIEELLRQFAGNESLRKRLLFGSDWPLIWEHDNMNIGFWWKEFETAGTRIELDSALGWQACRKDLTHDNPKRFLKGRIKRGSMDCKQPAKSKVLLLFPLVSILGDRFLRFDWSPASSADATTSDTGNGSGAEGRDIAIVFDVIDEGTLRAAPGYSSRGAYVALQGKVAIRIEGTEFFMTTRRTPDVSGISKSSTALFVAKKDNPRIQYRLDRYPLKNSQLDRATIDGRRLSTSQRAKWRRNMLWHHNQRGVSKILRITNHELGKGAKSLGRTVTLFKHAGRYLWVYSAAQSEVDIYHAENKLKEFAVQVAGGIAARYGGVMGCETDAATGAVAGSAVDGTGALPGIILGCVSGTSVLDGTGWIIGREITQLGYEWIFTPLEKEEFGLLAEPTDQ